MTGARPKERHDKGKKNHKQQTGTRGNEEKEIEQGIAKRRENSTDGKNNEQGRKEGDEEEKEEVKEGRMKDSLLTT